MRMLIYILIYNIHMWAVKVMVVTRLRFRLNYQGLDISLFQKKKKTLLVIERKPSEVLDRYFGSGYL